MISRVLRLASAYCLKSFHFSPQNDEFIRALAPQVSGTELVEGRAALETRSLVRAPELGPHPWDAGDGNWGSACACPSRAGWVAGTAYVPVLSARPALQWGRSGPERRWVLPRVRFVRGRWKILSGGIGVCVDLSLR